MPRRSMGGRARMSYSRAMTTPLRNLALALALGLALAACSKCDAAGWFKSCGGDTVPKAALFAQYR
jgi:hypothetical protein